MLVIVCTEVIKPMVVHFKKNMLKNWATLTNYMLYVEFYPYESNCFNF